MEPWDAYLVALVVVVGLAVAHGIRGYLRTRGRWGEVRVPLGEAGDGAYRSAQRFSVVTPRAPGRVLYAGLLARLWAALTLMVFVPAGGMGVLAFVGLGEETVLSTLLGIVLGGLVLSGLGLVGALFLTARAIEKREPTDARSVVRWSLVHHALVAAVFLVEGLALDPGAALAALAVVVPVCAVGAGVTLALRSAAERAELAPA